MYTSHKADGSPDAFPDPACCRPGSARLRRDYTQLSKTEVGSPRIFKALKWFEENPPSGLQLPDMCPVYCSPNKMSRFMYRVVFREGWAADRASCADPTAGQHPTPSAGSTAVPADIAETITQLCAKYSSEKPAASPPAPETWNPHHRHFAGPFEAGGMPVRACTRLQNQRAHACSCRSVPAVPTARRQDRKRVYQ